MTSQLDNVNSLLVGMPQCVVKKLQILQNNAARLVYRKKKRDHVTPIMKELHWLPAKAKIQYKICLLTFKDLHGLAPPYLTSLLSKYRPRRFLQLVNRHLLVHKILNLKQAGGRTFSVSAPVFWNSLPDYLKAITDLEA